MTETHGFLNLFDWYVPPLESSRRGVQGHKRRRDPMSIFAPLGTLHEVLAAARTDFDPGHRERFVVFGGGDKPWLSEILSKDPAERRATVEGLRAFFSGIFVEARDIDVDGVEVMPMGLFGSYAFAHVENASSAIEGARLKRKHGSILAAWNYRYWLDNPSREDAQAWVKQDMGYCATRVLPQCTEVVMHRVLPSAWWMELSVFRFLLMPVGSAIQVTKLVESLLVLTIPIVSRKYGLSRPFEDLVQLGFPIVIVDNWPDITPQKLNAWWHSLSPVLERWRRLYLTTKWFWHYVRCSIPSFRDCGNHTFLPRVRRM